MQTRQTNGQGETRKEPKNRESTLKGSAFLGNQTAGTEVLKEGRTAF